MVCEAREGPAAYNKRMRSRLFRWSWCRECYGVSLFGNCDDKKSLRLRISQVFPPGMTLHRSRMSCRVVVLSLNGLTAPAATDAPFKARERSTPEGVMRMFRLSVLVVPPCDAFQRESLLRLCGVVPEIHGGSRRVREGPPGKEEILCRSLMMGVPKRRYRRDLASFELKMSIPYRSQCFSKRSDICALLANTIWLVFRAIG